MKKVNYSAVFFPDGSHMTWYYGDSSVKPSGVKSGDKARVKVIGKYSDDQVACWVVQWKDYKNQPSGKVLHITSKVQNGGKPYQSGQRASQNGYKKIDKPFYIDGVWN